MTKQDIMDKCKRTSDKLLGEAKDYAITAVMMKDDNPETRKSIEAKAISCHDEGMLWIQFRNEVAQLDDPVRMGDSRI